MESIIKATSYPPSSPIQPAYTQTSQTDWGKDYIKEREFEEQICFGLWHSDGGWVQDEVIIRWYQEEKGLSLRISDIADQHQKSLIHPELFEFLQDYTLSPDAVVQKLQELGYQNVTHEY